MMRIALSICTLLIVLVPLLTEAQFNNMSTGLTLETSPRFPEPGETVTISLNDFSLQGNVQRISWSIDGEQQATVANQRSIQLTAGSLGQTTDVAATLYTNDGQVLPVRVDITPSRLTLIVEPYTVTPSWYQGRALPSVGSQVRVVALPQTGSEADANNYTYTWRLNGDVINAGGMTGGYQTIITMPYGRNATLSVDVSNEQGSTVAQRSIAIPNVEPEVYFYELNPLRGISRLALTEQVPLVGSEMTVWADSYYIGQGTDDSLLYEWKVDGRTVENPSADPRAITFQNGGGTGSFSVDFHVRNTRDLLQGAENKFNLLF